jgi:hypothetical protein
LTTPELLPSEKRYGTVSGYQYLIRCISCTISYGFYPDILCCISENANLTVLELSNVDYQITDRGVKALECGIRYLLTLSDRRRRSLLARIFFPFLFPFFLSNSHNSSLRRVELGFPRLVGGAWELSWSLPPPLISAALMVCFLVRIFSFL